MPAAPWPPSPSQAASPPSALLRFFGCSSLQSIDIPNGVTTIADSLFSVCINLERVTIPNSVTSIGNGAFFACIKLEQIDIPSSVTSIGNGAFRDCFKLKSVIIPPGVTSIGTLTFSSCRALTSITIPSSVTSIGDEAFYGCIALPGITIPGSVTSIGFSAFSGCAALSNVAIPNSVTSVGGGAFNNCDNALIIAAQGNNYAVAALVKASGFPYAGTAQVLTPNITPHTENGLNYYIYQEGGEDKAIVGLNPTASGAVDIPAAVNGSYRVVAIAAEAFASNAQITSLTIPDTVASIGDFAFDECSALGGALVLPSNLTHIGERAFNRCTGLSGPLVLPPGVTSIGNYAFSACSGFSGTLVIPPSVASIGTDAFLYCTGFTGLTLSNGIDGLGDGAFAYCTNIEGDLVIPSSVTRIGSTTFQDCYKLQSVTIPNSVTRIDSNAFASCHSLASVTIPNSVTSIDSSAFLNCRSLADITIPNSVTTIESNAFLGCTALAAVTIPNSVTTIGGGAFARCTGLREVFFGSGLTSIQYTAFHDATGNLLPDIRFSTSTPRVQLVLVRDLSLSAPPLLYWDGTEDLLPGNLATIRENLTLTAPRNIPAGASATVEKGATFALNEPLALAGELQVDGALAGEGVLTVQAGAKLTGEIWGGNLAYETVYPITSPQVADGRLLLPESHTGPLSITLDADYATFHGVQHARAKLEAEAKSGSTVVTLSESFLQSIRDRGPQSLLFAFESGGTPLTLLWDIPTKADPAQNSFTVSGGATQTAGVGFTVTATGHRQGEAGAIAGDTRFIPKDTAAAATAGAPAATAVFPAAAPYAAGLTIETAGSYTLAVTYREEAWDGAAWQPTGATDTKTLQLAVTAPAPGPTPTPPPSSPQTGDDGAGMWAALAFSALALGGLALAGRRKTKPRRGK